ncbi:hypothetical protein IRZ71_13190 [Flavobacterium sp. ANB]|uniref:hypothetical protein n=1 Tax=unclassified Flavobacterium TaxID=196869 RepID=UPI0012B824E3|nr:MULTISPECIES: hypothetical protein [unclassified Flavobacterium]MBF4517313.1 hypothetical protein [Flavobacterium sp. ANB]MTD70690.1 hypothetical protein [Flavobacterium sp. LC2016-13]
MDNKTKFFKNTLVLQFILVLLLGILISSNFREQKTLRIRQLHPYEFNYGYAIPLFIFGIGLVLALFSLFSKQEDTPQDEAEILKIKRKQNFWKFAFYCNVFFVIVIAIFSAIIFRENPIVIDQPILFYGSIVLRALLVVLISLIAASFFFAAGINWKTNKTLTAVILIFSFFIIGVSIFGDVLFLGKFHDASESYKMAKSEKKIPAKAEEQLGDYDESNNYNESEEGSGDEQNEELQIMDESIIIDSWKSMREDFFVKKNGTSDDFVGLRIYVYGIFDGQLFDNDYRVLSFISDLRDHPAQIQDGLESYKLILYSTISTEVYRSNHFDQVVDALLLAYDDVGKDGEKLDSIFEIMQNEIDEDEKNIGKFLPGIKNYCSSDALKKLSKNKVFFKHNSDIVWVYSFWARRNKEGNIDKVYKVLREIQEHYI